MRNHCSIISYHLNEYPRHPQVPHDPFRSPLTLSGSPQPHQVPFDSLRSPLTPSGNSLAPRVTHQTSHVKLMRDSCETCVRLMWDSRETHSRLMWDSRETHVRTWLLLETQLKLILKLISWSRISIYWVLFGKNLISWNQRIWWEYINFSFFHSVHTVLSTFFGKIFVKPTFY